jgi:hypothetical protein
MTDGTIIKVGTQFYAGNLLSGGSRLLMSESGASSFFSLESAARRGVRLTTEYPGRAILINSLGRDFALRHWENFRPEWYVTDEVTA